MSASSTTLSVAEAVDAVKASGTRMMVLCPAHPDKNPSLSITPGNSQPVVLHCHAGCEQDAIIEAAGIDWDEICNERDGLDALANSTNNWTFKGPASHIYPYVDEQGKLLYEVLRVPLAGGAKTFLQRVPDAFAKGGYEWKLDGVRRVPYRLPHLLQAVAEGRTVHIAEGEKDVHSLLRVIDEGDAATTNAGGSGVWGDDAWGPMFAGATVVIYADADDPGRRHARHVRESLMKYGARVRILEAPQHKDVTAHLEAKLSLADLLETTPESMAEKARTGIDVQNLLLRVHPPVEWAIPHTLAMGDRLLLTGLEGHGKSTLFRQMAVMAAAGIHWVTGRECEPKRMLMIDAENHPSQVRDSWSDLIGLAARHDHPVEPGMLTIMEEWDGNHDFTTEDGKAWLEERLWAYKPHAVFIGPLTNVVHRDLKYYEAVHDLRTVLDASRKVCGSAVVMEHHAPKRGNGDKIREVSPYGSGLFLKWPDFAFAMVPSQEETGVYEWDLNRGPRVRGRVWPTALRQGTRGTAEWPWMECALPPRKKGR